MHTKVTLRTQKWLPGRAPSLPITLHKAPCIEALCDLHLSEGLRLHPPALRNPFGKTIVWELPEVKTRVLHFY